MGIFIQDTKESLERFLEDTGISFPSGIDINNTISNAYEVPGIPTHVFIDKKGRMFYQRTGPMSTAEIEQKIEEIL